MGLVSASDKYFRPNVPATREEMAVMMLRAMEAMGEPRSTDVLPLPFKDKGQVSTAALGEVTRAWNKGLMRGVGSDLFSPQGTSTRAQAAVVMLRILERLGLVISTSVAQGTITVSHLEGRHLELIDCAGSTGVYVLVAISDEVERQLEALVGQTAQVVGLLSTGVNQYMTGPTLRVTSAAKLSGG